MKAVRLQGWVRRELSTCDVGQAAASKHVACIDNCTFHYHCHQLHRLPALTLAPTPTHSGRECLSVASRHLGACSGAAGA